MKTAVTPGSTVNALSNVSYANPGDNVTSNYSKLSVSVTAASPAVVTHAAHGYTDGTAVAFSEGTLPTGLTVGTTYFVKSPVLGVSYNLALTAGGAAINTTGSTSSGAMLGLAGA